MKGGKMKFYVSLRREQPNPKLFDGVGLVKGEYAEMQEHQSPKSHYELEQYLSAICKSFFPKPVWYRVNDASTQFVNGLSGGTYYEEKNPHFGLRGVRRAIIETKDFIYEIKAVQKVRDKYSNLNILLSMTNCVEQYVKARNIAYAIGYNGEIGIMAETPSAVLTLDDYISEGCVYVVFGLNDLSDCMDGASRKNSTNHLIHRDSSLKAVIKLLSNVKKEHHVEYVLSGDFPPKVKYLLSEHFDFDAIAIPFTLCGQYHKKVQR
jgi:pyruvate, water dikinase